MSGYTNTWNEASPADSDARSQGALEIRKLKVDIHERLAFQIATKTSDFTCVNEDGVLLCDATGAAITGNLPLAVGLGGKVYHFIKIDNSINAVTPLPAGSDTLDVAHVLRGQYDSVRLVSDNVSKWFSTTNVPTTLAIKAMRGLKVIATGLDADVSITADEIVAEDASNVSTIMRSVSATINTSTTGANGLDTGTIAAATWYSVWIIRVGAAGTVAGLISLSATAPTLPTGYTHMVRVGWIRTAPASTTPLGITQIGKQVQYRVNSGGILTALPTMASGLVGSITTPTWVEVDTSNFVPATATKIKIITEIYGGGAAIIAPNNSYGPFPTSSIVNPPFDVIYQTIVAWLIHQTEMILESSNIYWATSTANTYMYAVGWEDNF